MDDFAKRLLAWFDRHGRHDLPWQHDPTPYRVWVSEVMLQQTQVATVIPYYQHFMESFPSLNALADADEDTVLAHWSGLGYYSRARNLHRAARLIRDDFGSEFPADINQVMALPGIGRSTAGAILALSRGEHHPILDGNVKRVLSRFHAVEGWPGKREVEQRLWQLAAEHTPNRRTDDYTQAIMDLGATLCTRSRPHCNDCPVVKSCIAHAEERVGEFPGKKPRKTLPVKGVIMPVVVNSKGEVLLQKRPPTGIWGGLWSLPECADMKMFEQWCEERLPALSKFMEMEKLKHTFSHFQLMIQPYHIELATVARKVADDGDAVWQPVSQLDQLGLPAPIQRILKLLMT